MTLSRDEIQTIAEEAYIYTFPMLMGYRFAFGTSIAVMAPSYRGPMNRISSDAHTVDNTFRDVISPNADTPYSMAILDLRAEPVVLKVPAVTDRYYVMQIEDLFGQNEHYVGTRVTGTGPGTYLLAGPDWDGIAPASIDGALSLETNLAFIIGRTQTFGTHDVANLKAVQDQYQLMPLSEFAGTTAPSGPQFAWPVWDDAASRDERFISYFNALIPLCKIDPSEAAMMDRFAQIGIGPGLPFSPEELPETTVAALRAGVDSARAKMGDKANHLAEKVNGWTLTDCFGDRDYFAGDYLLRAAGAQFGWGGNDKIEAFYPGLITDADGDLLDGSNGNAYTMKLTSPPPAQAFWSVTLYDKSYDGTAGYLVDNPIGRYLINSVTEGLATGKDGSLTICIQHAEPTDSVQRANWLPAPDGPFYMIMRIYMPETAALDGTWSPPPVEKA